MKDVRKVIILVAVIMAGFMFPGFSYASSVINYNTVNLSDTAFDQGSKNEIFVEGSFWQSQATPRCAFPPPETVPFANYVNSINSINYDLVKGGEALNLGRTLIFNQDWVLQFPGVDVDCGEHYTASYDAFPDTYFFRADNFKIPVANLDPGEYKVRLSGIHCIWLESFSSPANEPGYPSQCSNTAFTDEPLTFTVLGGTVKVISNVATNWTISGAANYNGTDGTTMVSYTNAPDGSYTIYPATLAGYNVPTVAPSSTQTLNGAEEITFTINYTATGGGNAPSVDLDANGSDGPISIDSGTAANLTWSSSGAETCTASGDWSGNKALNNSSGESTGNLTSPKTYTLICTNSSGSSSDSVTVNINGQANSPAVDLKINGVNGPISVASGATVTLSWVPENSTSCTASGDWSGSKNANGDSEPRGPLADGTYNYTITCSGDIAPDAQDSVTVNVGGDNQPPIGVLESPDNFCTIIGGWAFDPDTSSTSIGVTVYEIAAGSGPLLWGGPTPGLRQDVNNAFGITGNHGYTLSTPADLRDNTPHPIRAYAIDSSGSPTVEIGVATVNCPPGAVSVDLKANGANSLTGLNSVDYADQLELTWTSVGASACTASSTPNIWAGAKATNNSTGELTTNIAGATTFRLTCVDEAGQNPVYDEVTVNVNPAGMLDAANCTLIGGWGFDGDNANNSPNERIAIHLYDGGAGVGPLIASPTTDGERPDVNVAYQITGRHGFTITTPPSLFDGNPHTIYAYGIDSNGGNNRDLGAITLQCSRPQASAVGMSPPDYCASGPAAYVGWSYSDAGGSPQTSYQVQVSETGNFNGPIFYDSGVVNSDSRVMYVPNLQFNVTYRARVRVWNSNNVVSDWSSPSPNFKTPLYAYPQVAFSYSPSAPTANNPVQFTDQTVFGGGNPNSRTWAWTFGDGGSASTQNPAHTYSTSNSYNVSLTATDAANQSCTAQQSINISKPRPIIKEVLPR